MNTRRGFLKTLLGLVIAGPAVVRALAMKPEGCAKLAPTSRAVELGPRLWVDDGPAGEFKLTSVQDPYRYRADCRSFQHALSEKDLEEGFRDLYYVKRKPMHFPTGNPFHDCAVMAIAQHPEILTMKNAAGQPVRIPIWR